jgi:hypothetical protein
MSAAGGALHAQGAGPEWCLAFQAKLGDVHSGLDRSGFSEAEDSIDNSLSES